jgi:acyl-CoA synthetase (AMP-forming)/AMP-acid ligase II
VHGFDLKIIDHDGACLATDTDTGGHGSIDFIGRAGSGSDGGSRGAYDSGDVGQTGTVSGELCVRGGSVASRYWRQPELTDSVFQKGWFHTGDVVRMDSEGWYYMVGRRADIGDLRSMLTNKERGLAIAYLQVGLECARSVCKECVQALVMFCMRLALQVEDQLLGLDCVADCAVLQEHAFIALQKQEHIAEGGSSSSSSSSSQLNSYSPGSGDMRVLAKQMHTSLVGATDEDSIFLVPSIFHFVDSIPRNARDKIDRGTLRRLASSGGHSRISNQDWGTTVDLRPDE